MVNTTPISDAFASERIRAAIRSVADKRARIGLARLDGRLARDRVAPGLRLHMIATLKQLSIDSANTRHARIVRAAVATTAEDDD